MDDVIKTKILNEISCIEKEINNSSPLINLCKNKEPDYIEISAAALLLHSFYNGIESVVVLFFKYIKEKLPNDYKWHKTLFEMAFGKNSKNIIIFKNEIRADLEKYLLFRHFIRHSYGSELKWDQMKYLINNINEIWQKVRNDFNTFIENN